MLPNKPLQPTSGARRPTGACGSMGLAARG